MPWYSGCSFAFSKILRPARRIAWVILWRLRSTGSESSSGVSAPSIEVTISSTVFTAMALAYSPPTWPPIPSQTTNRLSSSLMR